MFIIGLLYAKLQSGRDRSDAGRRNSQHSCGIVSVGGVAVKRRQNCVVGGNTAERQLTISSLFGITPTARSIQRSIRTALLLPISLHREIKLMPSLYNRTARLSLRVQPDLLAPAQKTQRLRGICRTARSTRLLTRTAN